MNKISKFVLSVEELISGTLLCLISVLVFISAVARTLDRPVNWAQDVALLAFGWLTFIGADVVAKSGKLINIDLLINKFPKTLQNLLAVIFDIMMLIFLAILVVYGTQLVSQSFHRMFNTLNLSYAWCTLAVPVGSTLMFCTICGRTFKDVKKLFNCKTKEEKAC